MSTEPSGDRDLFGDLVSPLERRQPYFPNRDEGATWSCSTCGGRYPIALGVDITILGPTFMLNFCTAECAEAHGFAHAGRMLSSRFALTGQHWIVLTIDERVPNPKREDDVREYSDAMYVYRQTMIERPTFEALIAQSEAFEAQRLEGFLDEA
jgi:hypothetical protein